MTQPGSATAPAVRRAAFSLPVRVYWEDTDAGGIVFYANYLKFFERARTEWLRALGVEQHALRERTGGMFVVTQTEVRYRAPARLDDLLLVSASLQRAGQASLTIAQQAWRAPGNATGDDTASRACPTPGTAPAPGALLLCEGTIRIGWVEAGTLAPGRIPSSILEVLRP